MIVEYFDLAVTFLHASIQIAIGLFIVCFMLLLFAKVIIDLYQECRYYKGQKKQIEFLKGEVKRLKLQIFKMGFNAQITWHTFDEMPPKNDTFLIRQDHHKVYFGRIVQGRILTCFVFQNLNGLTNGAIAESGKPLADWVNAQKPRVPNKNTELVWSAFDWQA